MGRPQAAHFSQEEQVVVMESYVGYKKYIMAKRNTVAANKPGEDDWQKITHRLSRFPLISNMTAAH